MFNESLEPSLIGLMNEKLARIPDEGGSTKISYLKNMRTLWYDQGDEKKRWTEKAVTRETRSVSRIRKEFE